MRTGPVIHLTGSAFEVLIATEVDGPFPRRGRLREARELAAFRSRRITRSGNLSALR